MLHWTWNFFVTDKSKYNGSYKNVWCKAELESVIATLREEDQAALQRHEVETVRDETTLIKDGIETFGRDRAICSRVDNMLRHLRDQCPHATQEIKQAAAHEMKSRVKKTPPPTSSLNAEIAEAKPAIRASETPRIQPHSASLTTHSETVLLIPRRNNLEAPEFSPDEQEEFVLDLVNLFSACGFAYAIVGHPVFDYFVTKYIPGARLPCRQVLSGRALETQVAKAEVSIRGAVNGKLAMGQCDGWKNVSRTPVIAVMMTVEQKVHNVGAASKTAENLVNLMNLNMIYATEKYSVKWIGWCTDAGGDARKARKLAFEQSPWLICPDCWAHQINLILGDYFKTGHAFMLAAKQVQIVVKWFNNHSRALGILRAEQVHTLGKMLALIAAVVTRWTSVYQSIKRLLECMRPLRAIAASQRDALLEAGGKGAKAKDAALQVLEILNNDTFWTNAGRIVSHLAPLTLAAYITQASSTRLDHVLLALANLKHIYSIMPEQDQTVGEELCASIEKRWAACDQDVFILAVFLNPYIRADLFNKANSNLNPAGLFSLVLRLWSRLFQRSTDDAPPGLRRATIDYYGRKEEFSDDRMHLKLSAAEARQKGNDIDIVEIWQQMDTGSFESGRNWLVVLAIRVLSVIANSAGCERLFSAMSLIHTDIRNRLELDRVKKTVCLKNALQREQEILGWNRSRLKRKTDNASLSTGPLLSINSNIDTRDSSPHCDPARDSFSEAAQKLVEEAEADTEEQANFRETFGRPDRIPLSQLFSLESHDDGSGSLLGRCSVGQRNLDQLWEAAAGNSTSELNILALLQSEQDESNIATCIDDGDDSD